MAVAIYLPIAFQQSIKNVMPIIQLWAGSHPAKDETSLFDIFQPVLFGQCYGVKNQTSYLANLSVKSKSKSFFLGLLIFVFLLYKDDDFYKHFCFS